MAMTANLITKKMFVQASKNGYQRIIFYDPIDLSKYIMINKLMNKLTFVWCWVDFVMKRYQRSLVKIKSKYWIRTNKYGQTIPKSILEDIGHTCKKREPALVEA